jgi:hypothetical protein
MKHPGVNTLGSDPEKRLQNRFLLLFLFDVSSRISTF